MSIPTATNYRIDEFQLFGVFFIGAFLLVGLLPFFTERYVRFSLATAASFVVLSYIVGQAIYETSSYLQASLGLTTHRELFAEELRDPQHVAPAVVDRVKSICERELVPVGDVTDDAGLDPDALYVLVVEDIRTSGGGFSMTLSSMYTFFRSGLVVVALLLLVYTVEVVAGPGVVGMSTPFYRSFFGSFRAFYLRAAVVYVALLLVFYRGYRTNMVIYVEYLFSDFVLRRSGS